MAPWRFQGEVNQSIHPLSTTAVFSSMNDSLQLSDVDDSDNNIIDDTAVLYMIPIKFIISLLTIL